MDEAQRRIDEWVKKNDITKILALSNLGLKELPPLPEGLTELDCGGNAFTSLSPLPESLIVFFCYVNSIFYPPADKISELTLDNLRDWMRENPYNLVKSANKR